MCNVFCFVLFCFSRVTILLYDLDKRFKILGKIQKNHFIKIKNYKMVTKKCKMFVDRCTQAVSEVYILNVAVKECGDVIYG